MKTIYLLLCLFLVGILNAQEESRNDTNSYRFKTETDIFPALFDSSNKEYKVNENPDRIFSRKKQIFEKIPESDAKKLNADSKYYFFRIYGYGKKSKEVKQSTKSSQPTDSLSSEAYRLNKKYVYEENGDLKTFAITKTAFDQNTTPYYSRYAGVTAGLVTMPIKLRLNSDDYEPNINLGLNVGFKFRITRTQKDSWQIQPTVGIGISDIPLNSANSNVKEIENRTAFTFSGGLLFIVNKTINLGVFMGWDKLSKINQVVDWKYQNKPWLGIGINVGFNSSNTTEPEKTNSSK